PTTHLITLTLHDALPIYGTQSNVPTLAHHSRNLFRPAIIFVDIHTMEFIFTFDHSAVQKPFDLKADDVDSRLNLPQLQNRHALRSEEHTSELQSPDHLVC